MIQIPFCPDSEGENEVFDFQRLFKKFTTAAVWPLSLARFKGVLLPQ